LKTRVLTIAALGIGVVLMIAASAGASGQAGESILVKVDHVNIAANMNTQQETPAPSAAANGAHGAFTGTVSNIGSDGADFTWKLVFDRLTGPATAAHLHTGERKEAGPVIVPLCGPCTLNQTGTAHLTSGDVSALRAGRVYVNIHTAANPAGEIRGQVDIVDKQEVTMNARQEIPRPKGVNFRQAKGGFTVTVTRSGLATKMRWRFGWYGLSSKVTAAHLHVGAKGKQGGVIVFLCGTAKRPCKNNRGGTTDLSQAQAQALENGNIYVNIHTRKNPAGEVRGQLRPARLWIKAT
jgi:CHRD domain-containing protein